MRGLDYISTNTLDETCAVLADHGSDACLLAGGTDLLLELRRPQSRRIKVIIDISRVADLRGVAESNGFIIIKSLETHARLVKSDILARGAPLLSTAASMIGSRHIRNRGTIGGNIMNAAACADTVPPLVALGATVTLLSNHGIRKMSIADLFAEPYRTCAHADEVLTEIAFPKPPRTIKSTFLKLGRRNALSISRLSVAAIIQVESDGRIGDARIVPGAAFPTWARVTEAEQILIGERPSIRLFALAGEKVSDAMIARTGRRWSTEYKKPVLAVLVRRALEQCAHPNIVMNAVKA